MSIIRLLVLCFGQTKGRGRQENWRRFPWRSEIKQLYMDRKADFIKHKGYHVAASEIEAVLQDHEAIVAACVIGVPDPKVGERIKAIVVAKEDVRGVGANDLHQMVPRTAGSL